MTGPRADVYLDGVLMASTAAEFYAQATTALSGLKIDWGRSTAIDQPEPSSLTLDFAQNEGTAEFLQSLAVGRRLDVSATGHIDSGAVANIMSQGDFEGLAPGTTPASIRSNVDALTVSTERAHTGTHSAKLVPTTATTPAWVIFPPAPFSADPSAWDGIPRASQGDAWAASAWVWAPMDAPVSIQLVAFTDPTGGPGTYTPMGPVVGLLGAAAWTLYSLANVPIPQSGRWLGLKVAFEHVGPAWVDVPGTWADQGQVTRTNLMINPNGVTASGFNANNGAINTVTRNQPITGHPQGITTAVKSGMTAGHPATSAVLSCYNMDNLANTGPARWTGAWVMTPAAGYKAYWVVDGVANAVALTPGQWAWVAAQVVTPANTYATLSVIKQSGNVTDDSDVAYVTGSTAEPGARPVDAVWGDRPPSGLTAYRWSGAVNASTSVAALSPTWLDYGSAYVDDVAVLAPAGGTERTVLVFQGRVTDMSAKYLSGLAGGTIQVDVTAKDFTADLANNRVGDQPWLVEALGTRVARILALAGGDVTAQVDDSIAATQVTWRDVDSQPAAGLITELAQSVAGVAWPAVHDPGGAYYWLEDPRNRAALHMLHLNTSTNQVEIVPNPTAPEAIQLSASNVLEEPIRFEQDVADVATRADITWLEQGVDDKGQPITTERHHVLVDDPLEAELGQRGFSVSTQLISDTDAGRVASALLAGQRSTEWRVSGVTWSIRYEQIVTSAEMVAALNLLDGTVRIGHSLVIDNLPAWVPVSGQIVVYIEGGSYTFEDGSWVLELVASSQAQGTGAAWVEIPATWPWTYFQHLAWVDLIGVAPPATVSALKG